MRFFARLLRHWYLYLIPLLVLPAVTTLYEYRTLAKYESTSYLLVSQPSYLVGIQLASGSSPYNTPAKDAAQSITQLLASEAFAVNIGKQTDLVKQYDTRSPLGQSAMYARVKTDLAVATSSGPNALIIHADDKNPHIAQQLVAALIQSYISYATQRQLSLDQVADTFYNQQLDQAKKQVQADAQAISAYIQSHPHAAALNATADPQYQQLQQQFSQDSASVTRFNSTLDSIHLNEAAAQNGSNHQIVVMDPPSFPLTQTLSKKSLFIYTGVAAGVALALDALIAGLLTLLDRKVYNSSDVQTIFDDLEMPIPLIEAVAQMPKTPKKERRAARREPAMAVSTILLPAARMEQAFPTDETQAELEAAGGTLSSPTEDNA